MGKLKYVLLNSIRCPFCKTSNYFVEYRGARTKQEKRREQAVSVYLIFFFLVFCTSKQIACCSFSMLGLYMQEEQRVVEAQIRMRMKEFQDDEERTRKRKEIDSSNRTIIPVQTDCKYLSVQHIYNFVSIYYLCLMSLH